MTPSAASGVTRADGEVGPACHVRLNDGGPCDRPAMYWVTMLHSRDGFEMRFPMCAGCTRSVRKSGQEVKVTTL